MLTLALTLILTTTRFSDPNLDSNPDTGPKGNPNPTKRTRCMAQEGNGPESMLQFIAACRGLPYKNGADQHVGLQVPNHPLFVAALTFLHPHP